MFKPMVVAVLCLVGADAAMTGTARADDWFDFGWFRPHRSRTYYSGPDYMPDGPAPYGYDDSYYDPGYDPYMNDGTRRRPRSFDQSYYEPNSTGPKYDGPPPIVRKPVKKVAHKVPAKPAATQSASAGSKAGTEASASTVTASTGKATSTSTVATTGATSGLATASTTPASSPTKAAGGALSCDKAGQVISGYGFGDVKPASCSGKVFAFNATRDGKSYSVKLDAASGELTEVKKVQ